MTINAWDSAPMTWSGEFRMRFILRLCYSGLKNTAAVFCCPGHQSVTETVVKLPTFRHGLKCRRLPVWFTVQVCRFSHTTFVFQLRLSLTRFPPPLPFTMGLDTQNPRPSRSR